MKKILYSAIFTAIVLSCGKKNDADAVLKPDFDSTTVTTDSIVAEKPIATTCYSAIVGKDSLFLSYEDNLGTVTGKMHYKNYQKDSSKGDLSGLSSGDTLKVIYTFESEGTISNREIWFLKKDKNLLEGIGNYDSTGENYADGKKVKFEGGHILKPANCKNVEKELQ